MLTRFLMLGLALGALALTAPATAAITQSFGDRTTFLATVSGLKSVSLALPGDAPVIVPEFVTGPVALSAIDGQLAGDGVDLISTELDNDVLVLNFARPVFAIGLLGGVVDEAFGFIDGELLVEAVGSGATGFSAVGGSAFLGLLSDTRFSQLRVSITSFDTDAASVAFVGLQGQIDSAVPEPATWLFLLAGFGLTGAGQRQRRKSARAALRQ